MTAAQLYDDYAGAPGRMSSVADLRRAFDTPAATSLVIDELLDISRGGAFKLDGVMVRSVATAAEVIAKSPQAGSDVALLTAAAGRQLVLDSIEDLTASVSTEVLSASHELLLAGAFDADLSGVRVSVPLDALIVRSQELHGDHIVARTLEADSLFSQAAALGRTTAGEVTAASLRTEELCAATVVPLYVLAGTAVVSGGLIAGDAVLGDLEAGDTNVWSIAAGTVSCTGGAAVSGALTCGGLSAAGDAAVSGFLTARAGLSTPGAFDAAGGALAVSRTRVTAAAPLHAIELHVGWWRHRQEERRGSSAERRRQEHQRRRCSSPHTERQSRRNRRWLRLERYDLSGTM